MDQIMDQGMFINVTSNKSGDSGNIPLARSNRYPDWYFFDIKDAKGGDAIIIGGVSENMEGGFLPIGGITFDLF